ncbi:hypothetical protein MBLNU230_g5104t1 [Neophaeotheca triangularis]
MLERATACLDSGARLSMRCASKRAAGSKRMLHANFWTHGAGDLEIPPWLATTAQPPPPDLPLGHDSNGSGSLDVSQGLEPRQEAPFLDFLYPPHALAWAHSVNGQSKERWKKRKARRLSEGLVHNTRQYGSMSTSRNSSRVPEQKETQKAGDDNGFPIQYEAGSPDSRFSGPEQAHRRSDEGKEAQVLLENDLEPGDAAVDNPPDKVSSSTGDGDSQLLEFGDSPADLAVHSPDRFLRLRNLLNRKLPADDLQLHADEAARAWELYESLDEDTRQRPSIMSDLLQWLSKNRSDAAATHTAWLYRQIPRDEKTLSVYLATLKSFLRRGNYVLAVKLHKEALKNAECGPEISEVFFSRMVETEQWRLAMHVQQYHDSVYSYDGGNKDKIADCVWDLLKTMPQLLVKAQSLAVYVRSLQSARAFDDRSRKFCVRFFRETMQHGVLKLTTANIKAMAAHNGLPRKCYRTFIHFVVQHDENSRQLLEETLMHMLTKYPTEIYPHLHHIVVYTYKKYCTMGGLPSRNIAMSFLERLTRYPKKLIDSKNNLTIESLVKDWKTRFGTLSVDAASLILWYYAREGEVGRVKNYLEQLQSLRPNWAEYSRGLSATIYVHARRADVGKANAAFEHVRQVTLANGQTVDPRCWNILIHAYSRADNLEGALEVLGQMLASNTKPDEYSFHPVLQMYAQRGDAEAIEELLRQYDETVQNKRTTALLASLINAYANTGEVERAEIIMQDTLKGVRSGQITGSMTGPFNIVLTAHSLGRSINEMMRLYNSMRFEGIHLNKYTYAALMRSLCFYRRTDSAWKILRLVMPKENQVPDAFHYALVMAGYTNQGEYAKALDVHRHLVEVRVKPSFSTKMAYIKAKALAEHVEARKYDNALAVPNPLDNTIKELIDMLPSSTGADFAMKQPQIGKDRSDVDSNVPGAYFDFLVFIHGKLRCFESVEKLFNLYRSAAGEEAAIPLRLLTALMSSYWRAHDFEEVDRLWNLAKAQANVLAQTAPVPNLGVLAEDEAEQEDPLSIEPPEKEISQPATQQEQPTERSTSTYALTPTAPARKFLLSHPLRYQMASLALQSRLPDLIKTVTNLLSHGYTLDNRTWNAFIEHLCRSSPPLTLLAFTLTERFLIPDWPGWRRRKRNSTLAFPPKHIKRIEGLEHIRASYLRPGQLLPQYRTLVMLGSALLGLRHSETVGSSGVQKELLEHVGTMRLVREKAPKTLYVVQSMPTVDDQIQRRLLRRG